MSFVTKEPHTQRVAAGGDVLDIGSKVAAQKLKKNVGKNAKRSSLGVLSLLLKTYQALTIPFSIVFILSSTKFDPAYRIGFFRKYGLGLHFFINKFRIPVLRDTLDSGMQEVQ
jgi:hypothetical protein